MDDHVFVLSRMSTFFDKARITPVVSFDFSEIYTLDSIRYDLENELELINEKSDIPLDEAVKSAQVNLRDALSLISEEAAEENNVKILKLFREAQQNSIKAFLTTANFMTKVIAMKLRILTTFYIAGYFTSDDNRDISSVMSVIQNIWNDFLDLHEVKSAIKDQFEPHLFSFMFGTGKQKRYSTLICVADVKHSLNKILCNGCPYDALTIRTQRGKLIQLADIKPLIGYKAHLLSVTALVVHGERLFSASRDDKIKVWDISPFQYNLKETAHTSYLTKPLQVLQGQSSSSGVNSLAIYEDRLYSGSDDCSINIWDIYRKNVCTEPIYTYEDHDGDIRALTIFDGLLYSGSEDKTIKVWDIISEETDPICTVQTGLKNARHSLDVHSLAIHQGILFAGLQNGAIHAYRVTSILISSSSEDYDRDQEASRNGSRRKPPPADVFPIHAFEGHTKRVTCLVISDNQLFSASWDHTIKIWDLMTNVTSGKYQKNALFSLVGHTNAVNAITISNNKLYSGSADKTIRVWNLYALNDYPIVPTAAMQGGTLGSFSSNSIRGICLDFKENQILATMASKIESLAIAGGRLFAGQWDGTISMHFIA